MLGDSSGIHPTYPGLNFSDKNDPDVFPVVREPHKLPQAKGQQIGRNVQLHLQLPNAARRSVSAKPRLHQNSHDG